MLMVEFLRDVVIAVAILMTLIAIALHPSPEADAARALDTQTARTTSPGNTPHAGSDEVPNVSVPGAKPR